MSLFSLEITDHNGRKHDGTIHMGGGPTHTAEQAADHIHTHDLFPWAKEIVVRESNAPGPATLQAAVKAAKKEGRQGTGTKSQPLVIPKGARTPRPTVGEKQYAVPEDHHPFPSDLLKPPAPSEVFPPEVPPASAASPSFETPQPAPVPAEPVQTSTRRRTAS